VNHFWRASLPALPDRPGRRDWKKITSNNYHPFPVKKLHYPTNVLLIEQPPREAAPKRSPSRVTRLDDFSPFGKMFRNYKRTTIFGDTRFH
jgi:hypothetical protein